MTGEADVPASRHLRIFAAFALGFFPSIACRASESAAPIRIAIVAEEEFLGIAERLMADLSARPGVEMLERASMDRFLREQSLTKAVPLSSAQAMTVMTARMFGADALVILRSERRPDRRKMARCKVLAIGSGIVLHSESTPWPAPDSAAWIDKLGESIAKLADRLRVPSDKALRFSIPKLKSSNFSAITLDMETSFHEVLVERLVAASEVAVLERQDMAAIVAEKAKKSSAMTVLQTGSILVEGNIEEGATPDMPVEVQITVRHPNETPLSSIHCAGSSKDIAELAAEVAAKILQNVGSSVSVKAWDPAEEAKFYEQRARCLLACECFADGLALADVAGALGSESEDVSDLSLRLIIGQLQASNPSVFEPLYPGRYDVATIKDTLRDDAALLARVDRHVEILRRRGRDVPRQNLKTILRVGEQVTQIVHLLDEVYLRWQDALERDAEFRKVYEELRDEVRLVLRVVFSPRYVPSKETITVLEHLPVWFPDPAMAQAFLGATLFPSGGGLEAVGGRFYPRTIFPERIMHHYVTGEPQNPARPSVFLRAFMPRLPTAIDQLERFARLPEDRIYWLVLRLEVRDDAGRARLLDSTLNEIVSAMTVEDDPILSRGLQAIGDLIALCPRDRRESFLREVSTQLWGQRERFGRSAGWGPCVERLRALGGVPWVDVGTSTRHSSGILASNSPWSSLPLPADEAPLRSKKPEARIAEGMDSNSLQKLAAVALGGEGVASGLRNSLALLPGLDERLQRSGPCLLARRFWTPFGARLDRGVVTGASCFPGHLVRDGRVWGVAACEFASAAPVRAAVRAVSSGRNYLVGLDARALQGGRMEMPSCIGFDVFWRSSCVGLEIIGSKAFVFWGGTIQSGGTGVARIDLTSGVTRVDRTFNPNGSPVVAAGRLVVPVTLGEAAVSVPGAEGCSGVVVVEPDSLVPRLLVSGRRMSPQTPLDVPCHEFRIRACDHRGRVWIDALSSSGSVVSAGVYDAQSDQWLASSTEPETAQCLVNPLCPELAPEPLRSEFDRWSVDSDEDGGLLLSLRRKATGAILVVPIALTLPTVDVRRMLEQINGPLITPTSAKVRTIQGEEALFELVGARIQPSLTPFGLLLDVRVRQSSLGFFFVPTSDLSQYLARHGGMGDTPAVMSAEKWPVDAVRTGGVQPSKEGAVLGPQTKRGPVQ